MQKLLQLNPMIPVEVVANSFGFPLGRGTALGWLDYSEEEHLIWVIGYDDTREVWLVQNPYVRLQPNITMGRK